MPLKNSSRARERQFRAVWAVLVAFGFLTVPAWPQDILTCGGYTGNTAGNFYSNFFNNPTTGYQIAIPPTNAAVAAGDLNSTYFPIYYSIDNANAANCKFELVVAGDFPDTRYFSIALNDMHYTATQHLADADIDPVGTTSQPGANPFVPGPPGAHGSSPPYTGSQAYLVPISLGTLPSAVNAGRYFCEINNFEGDNLLDATQRHLSIDWNTNVQNPSVSSGLAPHVVDTPSHSIPNTAGSLIVRSYLSPESCPGGVSTCQPSPAPAQPYLIVRDSSTGCAYTAQDVANYLLYDPTDAVAVKCNLKPAIRCPTPATAILSTINPSAVGLSNWMDVNQQTQHTDYANVTPQACYADGDPTVSDPPPFPNRVAWTRVAQWEGSPGPDDIYIGGAVSTEDLAGVMSGSACGQTGESCVMRFRFRLPAMPDTPCPPVGGAAPCGLSGNPPAQLRYMSLTFWYQTEAPAGLDGFINPTGYSPVSIVSLADSAFARSPDGDFVTLLVNAGDALPAALQQTPGEGMCATTPPPDTTPTACGVTQGLQPVANLNPALPYSVWTVNGYTLLDLTQLGFTPPFAYPLLVTIRSTLPASGFTCSAAAVPFSTAEYTDLIVNDSQTGSGLMGPFVPLVDYVNPATLPATAAPQFPLPAEKYCGILPAPPPSFNAPHLSPAPHNDCLSQGAFCVDFPNQYWPSNTTNPMSPNLDCPTAQPAPRPPQPAAGIYFVATQFTTPAVTYATGTGQNCATPQQPNACNQIVVQSPQTSEFPGGTSWPPPLPLTIVGAGFGALQQPLPFAGYANLLVSSAGNQLLMISDDGNSNGGTGWNTSGTACQVYIANWTDTAISLVANLPAAVQNFYQDDYGLTAVLSPLDDFSPLTFPGASECPVAYNAARGGDNLTITVMNPQTGVSYTTPKIQVSQAGTTLF